MQVSFPYQMTGHYCHRYCLQGSTHPCLAAVG